MEKERKVTEAKEVKDTRGSKDIAQKNFEAYPDVAADVINALLYSG